MRSFIWFGGDLVCCEWCVIEKYVGWKKKEQGGVGGVFYVLRRGEMAWRLWWANQDFQDPWSFDEQQQWRTYRLGRVATATSWYPEVPHPSVDGVIIIYFFFFDDDAIYDQGPVQVQIFHRWHGRVTWPHVIKNRYLYMRNFVMSLVP